MDHFIIINSTNTKAYFQNRSSCFSAQCSPPSPSKSNEVLQNEFTSEWVFKLCAAKAWYILLCVVQFSFPVPNVCVLFVEQNGFL
jgi:hypothetical protein